MCLGRTTTGGPILVADIGYQEAAGLEQERWGGCRDAVGLTSAHSALFASGLPWSQSVAKTSQQVIHVLGGCFKSSSRPV